MSIRVKVMSHDGTVDVWGNVLNITYSAGSETLTIRHGDGTARIQTKTYYSGKYRDVELSAHGLVQYDLYPSDAVLEH